MRDAEIVTEGLSRKDYLDTLLWVPRIWDVEGTVQPFVPASFPHAFFNMADESSLAVAILNSSTSVQDCLTSLSSMQISDKAITFANGKFKWIDSFESLKLFVETTLKLTGKWSSPSGHLKLFNEASDEVVIRYYTNTSSLLFQGDKGDELGNGLADKIKSFSQPVKSGNLLLGCSNSTSVAEGSIVSGFEEVHESITNFCKANSNDLSERNLPIMYGVDNSCQTQETGEWETRGFYVCRESLCLCEQVSSDIKNLKAWFSELQSSVFSFETILKDHDSILYMYNKAADLNEKYLKEINDSKRLITCLEQKIAI